MLVSLPVVLQHLKLAEGEYVQDDLASKMQLAEVLVLKFIERDDTTWDQETDTTSEYDLAIVQGAILKVLQNLWRFRGDDQQSVEPLDASVKQMLWYLKYPVLG